MRIVFWQNMLAIANSAYIRALADIDGLEVVWVAQESLSKERKALGWGIPETGKAKIVIAPDKNQIRKIIYNIPDESIHIFSGHLAYQLVKYAFSICKGTAARIGFITESFNYNGLKGALRFARSRLDAIKHRKRVDFILIIGSSGMRWLVKCGWPEYKLYPFAYLEDPTEVPRNDIKIEDKAVKLIFLGQCVKRKGVDVFLRALQPLSGLSWSLTIVGDGPQRDEWIKLTERLGLSGKVNFMLSLNYGEAMRFLSKNDLLVLPSRFDGWGAVINEALMLGIPVICSDRCGATDLLQEGWRGAIFKSESVPELTQCLKHWIKNGKRTEAQTNSIKAWAEEYISARAGAKYILNVIKSSTQYMSNPKVPWLCD